MLNINFAKKKNLSTLSDVMQIAKMYADCVSTMKVSVGEDHQDTKHCISRYANFLSDHEMQDDAVALYEELVKSGKSKWGLYHLKTLRIEGEQLDAYIKLGMCQEVETTCMRRYREMKTSHDNKDDMHTLAYLKRGIEARKKRSCCGGRFSCGVACRSLTYGRRAERALGRKHDLTTWFYKEYWEVINKQLALYSLLYFVIALSIFYYLLVSGNHNSHNLWLSVIIFGPILSFLFLQIWLKRTDRI